MGTGTPVGGGQVHRDSVLPPGGWWSRPFVMGGTTVELGTVHGQQREWSGASTREAQGSLPQHCPPSIHVVFNKDFLYLPLQIKAGEGHRVGNRTQDFKLQGDCPPWTLRVDATFCPHCARDSCLYPWTQGRHLPGSARWAPGHRPRQGSSWTALWPARPATLASWASCLPLPLPLLSPRSCLSGVIRGFFSEG